MSETTANQLSGPTEEAEDDSGITRFFKRLFGFENDDYHVSYYSQVISEGRYLVAVDAPSEDQAERAADAMQRLGALDIDDIDDLDVGRSAVRPGAQAGTAPMGRGDTAQRGARPSGDEIPLQGRPQRGGVRVYTRAYDIPTEEKLRLREEHAAVQRRPVEQLAAEQKPLQQHPHLETMDDDPYAESMFTKPKQQK